jgi:arginyl-tRNA synthetase
MKSLLVQLRQHVTEALVRAFGDAAAGVDPLVRASADPKFGDYQSNVAMGLAKKLGSKPRDVAQKIVDALVGSAAPIQPARSAVPARSASEGELGGVATSCEPARSASEGGSGRPPCRPFAADSARAFTDLCDLPEIAGPGFINFRLKPAFLESTLASIPAALEEERGADLPSLARRAGTEEAGPAAMADQPMWTPLPTDTGFDRLGIERVPDAERDTVVIDYSSPNVAKQMHVGHLRSTIIGDTIARVLEFEGHDVIRQNHIGDWGTQFGIILEELHDRGLLLRNLASEDDASRLTLPQDPAELEAIYKSGNAKMVDQAFAERARAAVTRLQGGDQAANLAWRNVTDQSMHGVLATYRQLGVALRTEHTRGESFYNPLLPAVAEELESLPEDPEKLDFVLSSAILATNSTSSMAQIVTVWKDRETPVFRNPEGRPLPIIARKSDRAFLYAMTDLAALAFRINDFYDQPIKFYRAVVQAKLHEMLDSGSCWPPRSQRGGLGARTILYVVGAPQKLHFEMLFSTVSAANLNWTRPGDGKKEVRLEHVAFGSVLGEDRKMLRTRSGESVRLKDLLDEAVQRAEKLVRETEADPAKRRGFSEEETKRIAEVVGISAVKYADLCQNRNTDYVFSWDKMLALQGNTAPYMLYAYARIRSIYRKGAEREATSHQPSAVSQESPAVSQELSAATHQPSVPERALALAIARLPETIDAVADSLLPSVLCDYLYDLAGKFMSFYEACPVLQAPDEATKTSRLRLCDLTARTLKLGLALLGIPTLERM